jgi:ligand-binding sensor domain-containing protein
MIGSKSSQHKLFAWVVLTSLISSWFCLPDLLAQETLSTMFHRGWTARDGAPNNIETISPGMDGFLWIASDDGLYRFDGNSFERMQLPPNLQGRAVGSVAQTEDGTLWISFLIGGLVRMHGNAVHVFTETDGLHPASIGGVTVVANHVWLCTSDGLADVSGGKVRYHLEEDGLSRRECQTVFPDI